MKELLEKLSKGETTIDVVLQAIDEADKDKVPRSRLNDKIDEINDLKSQLKDRDTQLVDLGEKAKGNEDLQKQINDLQDANKQAATDYQAKLDKQAFDFSLEKALSDAKAKNPKAVKALLNHEAIKLDGDKLLGLEEQLKTLQESDGYLFGENEAPGLSGRTPRVPGQPPANGGVTKEKFQQMGYAERAKLYTDNPDLYKQLNS
ncbi:phage scaffolding protein [Peribacillus frigoritolerans]|uniref:phage scaffolding protein n=1 Tax=Peribacillus frigoritolerans TaxID=450367 RepID=UPI002162CCCB|nr:phage scaffolding protein [Peribacillus frigoritolerans]